jgi:hypothetical protein
MGSSFIAFYRIIYIKAQNWLKFRVGEKVLLRFLLGVGTAVQVCGVVVVAAVVTVAALQFLLLLLLF